ncbi:MAG: glycogen/starch/alpha-glucan phosphorylase [Firmicutes bacterium]|nr:glycogen/starch/alpha-glucan phosphorylase [Bacillota bacterium]
MTLDRTKIKELLEDKLDLFFASSSDKATEEHFYKATALVLRDIMLKKKQLSNKDTRKNKRKRVYYLCMEFLIGRNLKNALFNLGIEKEFRAVLAEMGANLDKLYEIETDPALGNGGLGRLAACFMDSLATLNYPATGYSIMYEYGLFKQKIVENVQVELPDIWLDTGEFWLLPRSDKSYEIKLGGTLNEYWQDGRLVIEHTDATVLKAIPHDLMIPGADSNGVSTLRLWKAQSKGFDMRSFSHGDYLHSMAADVEADIIGKVLYPADEHYGGKQLRVSQQYFLVSASLQDILRDHIKHYGDLESLQKLVSIHLNDTHPALAVPELMRLLMDEHNFSWERAWEIVTAVTNYTNHTVLSEALEKWERGLLAGRLPRIYRIIKEIDRRFVASTGRHDLTVIDNHNQVRMANLCVIGSTKVNGVSALHSEIIKQSVFRDFYEVFPDKFTNVTNGIAHRRWLTQSNPRLHNLICELIGEGYYKNAKELEKLKKFSSDNTVLDKLAKIKEANKEDFAKYLSDFTGQIINPKSRVDVQIKRMHEYKRQLLNVLKIIGQYAMLLENPDLAVTPETFIFGGKAAGGYSHAKRVISLICNLSEEISKNKKIKDKLNVIYIENYNASKAERIFPASDVSEQISLAGKEASGTGNMKFMINGAVTLGTLDGANVEINEAVGDDNIFIFGLKADEVENLWRDGYFASRYYAQSPILKKVIDMLKIGFNGVKFDDIANYLVLGHHNVADPFMCLADFDDYIRATKDLDKAYQNSRTWQKMCLRNIAEAGRFASDRAIEDYARDIWKL